MISEKENCVKVEMVIRKPVDIVFDAFVDPEVTRKFWFSESSGKLEPNAKVEWSFEKYNVTVPVEVLLFEINKLIKVEWGNRNQKSFVEWKFNSLKSNFTQVVITNYGFQGSDQEIFDSIIDSTGGFTFVLAGLKAFLEHEVELNLVNDKFPPT